MSTPQGVCAAQIQRATVEIRKYERSHADPRAQEFLAEALAHRNAGEYEECDDAAQRAVTVTRVRDSRTY